MVGSPFAVEKPVLLGISLDFYYRLRNNINKLYGIRIWPQPIHAQQKYSPERASFFTENTTNYLPKTSI